MVLVLEIETGIQWNIKSLRNLLGMFLKIRTKWQLKKPKPPKNKDDSSPHCRFHVYNVQDETKHSPPNEGQSLRRRFSPKVAVCEEAEAILDAQCATFSCHNKAILVSDKCEACAMEIQSQCPLVTVIQAAAKCRFLRPTLELKMDSSVVTVAFLVPASSIVVPPLTWFRKKHVEKTFSPC